LTDKPVFVVEGTLDAIAERTCDFQPDDNDPEAAPMAFGPRCGKPASFTTCDPCGGSVCEAHKCRCSKPLAGSST
jgi:hypothetical protein